MADRGHFWRNEADRIAPADRRAAPDLFLIRSGGMNGPRPVVFALPPLTRPKDAVVAMVAITKGVADGALSASEGADFARVVDAFTQTVARVALIAAGKPPHCWTWRTKRRCCCCWKRSGRRKRPARAMRPALNRMGPALDHSLI